MRVPSLSAVVAAQRGHLFPWVPVAFGTGIGLYFAVPWEPAVWMLWAGASLAAVLMLIARRVPEGVGPLVVALAALACGHAVAGARAHLVAAPVLEFRYYGPVEGRIAAIDRSASDKMRLTLTDVVLLDVAPARTPERVRVSLHHAEAHFDPVPGMRVATTGHLSGPEGPVEPGGFDFQRMAWFDRIGAVGYSRMPLVMTAAAPPGGSVQGLRIAISRAVQAQVPGENGAFAAAILTGDRSGIGTETLQALRDSNLAHLLAISGLHMGLLTGFVFAALRLALALHPRTGLTWPGKKIAAVVAIVAGAAYYLLSGGNVATERAFIMVAVALSAVLVDRRALTLRAVAIAALIVLVLRPETLTEPGFQMSFAATTALVAVFAGLRDTGSGLPRWTRPILAVVVSSAVAGAATAPVAAAHFNRLSDYGLIANLASVPLMGLVVMPAAVLAACLWPLGLSWIGLWLMRWPIAWILGVAHAVAGWDGAVTPVPSPQGMVLPLFAVGGLIAVLWQGRGRWAGMIPLAAALALWSASVRPALLISPDGGLMGVMTEAGRALSKERGQGFAAQVWLENDGDAAAQPEASGRAGIDRSEDWIAADIGGVTVRHVSGRGVDEKAVRACALGGIVVSAAELPGPAGPCHVHDGQSLRKTGAVALVAATEGPRTITARQLSGDRLWTGQ
ncbi:ComEC/Rec2 family competence protein [Anianabacter salinae]|uniref:ComEC/Rec2 family competence protein n=1 Tax=Anianabacter salinae TaxID=2851023 RepID=UPI00225E6001|nr:ComEC/Rec2 family competence protein [Anianabacter salinae]MBV0911557.1 ComEC family competence protein [Anianabacter salinae]